MSPAGTSCIQFLYPVNHTLAIPVRFDNLQSVCDHVSRRVARLASRTTQQTWVNDMTADTEERVARLEGAYEHLATKADVEGLRGEMNGLRGEVRLLASLVVGVQIAAAALIFSRIAG